MKFILSDIITFEWNSIHAEAASMFGHFISSGLFRFYSDMVERWQVYMVCEDEKGRLWKEIRPPKYYAERILTLRDQNSKKVRICKELVVDFPLDYETYAKAQTEEECMKVLAREFTRFIETMPYPMELRDTFDRKAFEQRVRDTLVRHELL